MNAARCSARFAVGFVTLLAAVAVGPASGNHYILCPDHCDALDVTVDSPGAVATDAQGNVYFSAINIVFRLDRNGVVRPVAGNGNPGFSGDGGLAIDALLNIPYFEYRQFALDPIDNFEMIGGVAVDPQGNLYVADAYNGRVRRIDSEGIITTVAGGGRIVADGVLATDVIVKWPQGLTADAWGNVYVSDLGGGVRRLGPNGMITTVVQNDCDPGLDGYSVCVPEGIAQDVAGNVYVAELGDCRIRKVSPDGSAMPVAGKANDCLGSAANGPALNTALSLPFGVATFGNVYIADTNDGCIRMVDAAGMMATVAGRCGHVGFAGDGGSATDALLNRPHGIAFDAGGNLYIADTENNRIRKVTLDGVITTVAGNGNAMPRENRGPDVK